MSKYEVVGSLGLAEQGCGGRRRRRCEQRHRARDRDAVRQGRRKSSGVWISTAERLPKRRG